MHCYKRLSCFSFPIVKYITKGWKVRCQFRNIFPATTGLITFLHNEKSLPAWWIVQGPTLLEEDFFGIEEWKRSPSRDTVIFFRHRRKENKQQQGYHAKTPGTVGPTVSEPTAAPTTAINTCIALVPATAWTRAKA